MTIKILQFLIKNTAPVCALGLLLILPTGCKQSTASGPACTTDPPLACKVAIDPGLQAFADDFDQYFGQEMGRTQTPGAAVAIVKDSQIILLNGYGLRNGHDSVTTATVFRLASLSKGFTGVLTGKMIQEGKLRWDEPVQYRYPQFTLRDKKQAARMQIRHLLSQTTGLPYQAYTNLIEAGFDVPTIIDQYFARVPLQGKEGTVFSYQNVAFSAIEPIMKSATGSDYPTLIARNIFEPLQMRHASCDYLSIKNNPDHAVPMLWTGYSWATDSITERYYNCAPAGGVNASIGDMAQWLRLLLGQRPDLVASSTLDQVFSPVISTERERHFFRQWKGQRSAQYAMGWRVLVNDTDTIIYHGGYVNGYKAEIAFDRASGIGICVLFNAATELAPACVPAFFDRWRAYRSVSVSGDSSKSKAF